MNTGFMRCSLYTGDGFFIRNGKEIDSADVLNTTHEYERKK